MTTPIALVSLDKDLIDLISRIKKYRLLGVIDVNRQMKTSGFRTLGSDQDWPNLLRKHRGLKAVIACDPPQRKRDLLEIYGVKSLASVLSPRALISKSAKLGGGCIVQHGVTILNDAQIGLLVKFNVNATVHHDCQIGDYCTLAPAAHLLGDVFLEDEVFVGAGAIVLPHVRVGRGAIIGAGAVVTSNVEAGTTVVGIPARAL